MDWISFKHLVFGSTSSYFTPFQKWWRTRVLFEVSGLRFSSWRKYL